MLLYDYVHGSAQYLYVLPANSTLAAPQQLPELRNRYHRASADVRHALTSQLALAFGYRLDKYNVDEFGRSPEILKHPAHHGVRQHAVPVAARTTCTPGASD